MVGRLLGGSRTPIDYADREAYYARRANFKDNLNFDGIPKTAKQREEDLKESQKIQQLSAKRRQVESMLYEEADTCVESMLYEEADTCVESMLYEEADTCVSAKRRQVESMQYFILRGKIHGQTNKKRMLKNQIRNERRKENIIGKIHNLNILLKKKKSQGIAL